MSYTRNFSLGALPGDEPLTEAQQRSVSRLFVEFYTHEIIDENRTAALGRPAHREIEMVRIITPGDRNSIVERRVREPDRIKHQKAYEAFKRGLEQSAEGTRLEDWSLLRRAQVLDLKAMGIFTVEAVANVSDSLLPSLGLGARLLRQHAQAYLHNAQKGQLPAAMVAENEALRNRVTLLTTQVGDLVRKMESLMAQAGIKSSDMPNPIVEMRAKAAIAPVVEIPADYQSMKFSDLRELVSKFSSAPVRNKDEALGLIVEYHAQQKALQ